MQTSQRPPPLSLCFNKAAKVSCVCSHSTRRQTPAHDFHPRCAATVLFFCASSAAVHAHRGMPICVIMVCGCFVLPRCRLFPPRRPTLVLSVHSEVAGEMSMQCWRGKKNLQHDCCTGGEQETARFLLLLCLCFGFPSSIEMCVHIFMKGGPSPPCVFLISSSHVGNRQAMSHLQLERV